MRIGSSCVQLACVCLRVVSLSVYAGAVCLCAYMRRVYVSLSISLLM